MNKLAGTTEEDYYGEYAEKIRFELTDSSKQEYKDCYIKALTLAKEDVLKRNSWYQKNKI